MNLTPPRGSQVDESVPSRYRRAGVHRYYRPCDTCQKTRGCAHQEEIELGCGAEVEADFHYKSAFCTGCERFVPWKELVLTKAP